VEACTGLIWLRRDAGVNAVMNLRIPNNAEKFLTEDRSVFQEGPCSME
jgi:hypothetical protein